jgi:hypothetical protein
MQDESFSRGSPPITVTRMVSMPIERSMSIITFPLQPWFTLHHETSDRKKRLS